MPKHFDFCLDSLEIYNLTNCGEQESNPGAIRSKANAISSALQRPCTNKLKYSSLYAKCYKNIDKENSQLLGS
jgi:hypothetical protein